MFGPRYISQKYLRRYGMDTGRARQWTGKMVHIRTNNGVWRVDGYGYTIDFSEAWRLPFEQALKQISHCGPEKSGTFILAGGQPDLI
jgi:hypothetical protein